MKAFFALLVALCAAIVTGCEPPDCDRIDFGSCGNACCLIKFHFEVEVDKLFEDVQALFNGKKYENGPDGRYTLQPMANGGNGWSDLTPHNLSVSYLGQAWHTTKTNHYNDTVDLNFAPGPSGKGHGSTLKLFSLSNIGGAYGDAGQNYKNVVQIAKAVGHKYREEVVLGCPKDPLPPSE